MAAAFKKRSQPSNSRKRPREEETAEGGEGDDDVRRERMQELLEMQAIRKKQVGISGDAVVTAAAAALRPRVEVAAPEPGEQVAYGLTEPAKKKAKKDEGVDVAFTTKSVEAVEKLKVKYVDDMMAAKRGVSASSSAAPAISDADAIYIIPEDLKVHSKALDTRPDALQVGAVTGVNEVQLSIEYKLRNIEETERAKRELIKQYGGIVDPEVEASGAADTAFGRFKTYKPMGILRQPDERHPGQLRSTDDIAAKRFHDLVNQQRR